ncbi:Lrp/AsnC family transcriptional regulator [uncultured Maritimibacter sp.]|jgi:DNA-binding Lrp family transcriptional regulator|uniref:Lrp/AsnC family transcriptional regulator n=1 Tax=uncultured Maritimibacter sp. TaxID=991866 RepID=UPI000A5318FD|nr:Lrp/AsnC family transcriptional regulator [uncultured Maritimibacter sp.]
MPRTDLDVIDGKILAELQNDARQSNVELARRVGLSPSPCLARVRAMERSGVIGRYVALVNPEIVGLGVSVFIQVTLERQVERALEAFEARMHAFPEVMECYLMTGDSDYLIRILVRDNSEVERFIVQKLSTIEGVANIKSSFALKQVKYKTEITVSA